MASPRCHRLLLAGLLLGLAVAAGCHAAPPAASAWTLSLATTPQDPSSQAATQFQLRLATPAGAPVDGARVTLNLVMATMDMGPNQVALAPEGHGLYAGNGQFTMEGDWNCTVTATLDGRTQRQVFHFKVS